MCCYPWKEWTTLVFKLFWWARRSFPFFLSPLPFPSLPFPSLLLCSLLCVCVFQSANNVTKCLQCSSISLLYPPLSVPGKMWMGQQSTLGLGKMVRMIFHLTASWQVLSSLGIRLDSQQISWALPLLLSPTPFVPFLSSYNALDTVLGMGD